MEFKKMSEEQEKEIAEAAMRIFIVARDLVVKEMREKFYAELCRLIDPADHQTDDDLAFIILRRVTALTREYAPEEVEDNGD